MDAHDSTSLSDAYDVQFVFVSDEEMSCEDSFSPASQLPFWWLNDEAACLHSLVVTTYIPLPVLKKFHVVRKVMAWLAEEFWSPCFGSQQRFGRADLPLHNRVVKPIEYFDILLIKCISVSTCLSSCLPAVRTTRTTEPQACKLSSNHLRIIHVQCIIRTAESCQLHEREFGPFTWAALAAFAAGFHAESMCIQLIVLS